MIPSVPSLSSSSPVVDPRTGMPTQALIQWALAVARATGGVTPEGQRLDAVSYSQSPGQVLAAGPYNLIPVVPYPLTLISLDYETTGGSFNVDVLVNGTPMPGLNNIHCSSPQMATAQVSGKVLIGQGARVAINVYGVQGTPQATTFSLHYSYD